MKINNFFVITLALIISLTESSAVAQISTNLKVVECDNVTDRCIVRNSSLKYGITDRNGKQILPCVYSDIEATAYNNYLVTAKDVKMGLVNKNGVFLLKPEYLSIKKSEKEGKYLIQPSWENEVGLADMKTGHIDIPAEYEFIVPMENGSYRVDKDEKMGVFNSDFRLIISPEYYFITLFPGNLYYRLHKKIGAKDVYGIADNTGKFVLSMEYDWIDKNPSSYKQTVRKGNKTYIFNTQKGTLSAK